MERLPNRVNNNRKRKEAECSQVSENAKTEHSYVMLIDSLDVTSLACLTYTLCLIQLWSDCVLHECEVDIKQNDFSLFCIQLLSLSFHCFSFFSICCM